MKGLYIFAFFVLTIVILAIVFLMLIIFNVIPTPNTTSSSSSSSSASIEGNIIKAQKIEPPKLQLATVVLPKVPEQQMYVPIHYLPFGLSSANMQKSSRYMSISKSSIGSLYHLQLPVASNTMTWRICLPMTDIPLANRPLINTATIYVHKEEQAHPATVNVLTDRILIDSDAFIPGAIINIPKTTFEKN